MPFTLLLFCKASDPIHPGEVLKDELEARGIFSMLPEK